MREEQTSVTVADDEAFDRLWREHAPAVLRYARRRVLPDDVDDVVAETFVVAWRRRAELPPLALPWLLAVARGVAANARRAQRRRDGLAARATAEAASGGVLGALAGAVDEDSLLVEQVGSALELLPEADRELLTLVAWDDLTPQEAAGVLGCSAPTARVRLHRARRRLRAAMARTGVDEPAAGADDVLRREVASASSRIRPPPRAARPAPDPTPEGEPWTATTRST